MGYGEYLRELLRPLGLYDVDEGAGAEELGVVGAELDESLAALELAEREGLLATAEGSGLAAYESILPFAPASADLAGRRAAIAALLRIDQCAFTVADLNATAAGCGMAVSIRESATPRTVEVSFPGVRGEPENLAALKKRLEAILPCHLGVAYVFLFLLWQELEADYLSWAALEAVSDWETLEKG